MGNPDMDAPLSGDQAQGIITNFYSSKAWIDGRATEQLNQVAKWEGVRKIAAFPDLHPGKYGPVGCAVLADRIYPQLIGNDIGCGMSLFQLDLPARKFKLEKAMRRMRVLGTATEGSMHARLEAAQLPTDVHAEALGSIGGGNHFCEVQTLCDGEGSDLDPKVIYLLVHSGSRSLGEAVFQGLPQEAFDGLLTDGEHAQAYINQHNAAVRWASLNRMIIAERAADALRADVSLICDAPHNLLADTSNGWLHRKGAAVASAVVPLAGSRASASYLVQATGVAGALASLAHGAGRRYDRASMHGRVRGKRSDLSAMQRTPFGGRVICEDRDMMIEEAPQAYKSAAHVLRDLEETGVAHRIATLNPLLTFKKIRKEGSQ